MKKTAWLLFLVLAPACSKTTEKPEVRQEEVIRRDARERLRIGELWPKKTGYTYTPTILEEGIPLKSPDGYSLTCKVELKATPIEPVIDNRGIQTNNPFSAVGMVRFKYNPQGEFLEMKDEIDVVGAHVIAARKTEADIEKWGAIVKSYCRDAGEQIMNGMGGGQNLYTNMNSWHFNRHTREYHASMTVTFRGAIIYENLYEVSGDLIVRTDGTNPRFNRTSANDTFRQGEKRLLIIGGASVALEALNGKR